MKESQIIKKKQIILRNKFFKKIKKFKKNKIDISLSIFTFGCTWQPNTSSFHLKYLSSPSPVRLMKLIYYFLLDVLFVATLKNYKISLTKYNNNYENLVLTWGGEKDFDVQGNYFDKKFSSLTAEQFIKKIINNKTKCRFLYVSKNFRFGFKRKGNIQTLKKFENLYDYKCLITKQFEKNNKIISSTLIRKKITLGSILEVNKLLKREWCIRGEVIKGEKRGRKIGFPTCNIKLKDYIVPRLGVYAVKIKGSNFNKKGIANIGYRPTFNGQSLLLETNIFGIKKNLYNKEINVNFIKFIRSEKKFKNLEHLKKQIKIDLKKAK